MRKLLPVTLTVFILFASLIGHCQQTVSGVRISENIYPCDSSKSHKIIALDDTVNTDMNLKLLKSRPSGIVQKPIILDKSFKKLTFKSDFNGIHHLTAPKFTFQPISPIYNKTGINRNLGGRTVAGTFTLLTGMSTTKRKYFKYTADFPFKEKDTTYNCLIGYVEELMADQERVKENGSSSIESTDFELTSRFLDTHFLNVINCGAETLATFKITTQTEASAPVNYEQLWDESDSPTIVQLSSNWNSKVKDCVITGEIGSVKFTMKTRKEMTIKEFYLNDQLVIVIQGLYEPVRGLGFLSVSPLQLKLFTILSTIPYAFFTYNSNP